MPSFTAPLPKTKKAEADALKEDLINVTARQSRYLELDDSADKDIDINDLSINIGKRDILQHTRLVLKAGLRYVFIGKNGLGKSTVLKALAERRMPGIPPIVRILLLDQTTIEQNQKDMLGSQINALAPSVLASVVGNDRLRQRLVHDSTRISEALQDATDESRSAIRVYRELKLQEAERDLVAARLVAQHRSGARGSKARQVLLQKEAIVQTLEEGLAVPPNTSEVSTELEAATLLLESMHFSLDAMGAATVEARARTALIGLGFSTEQIEGPMSNLSGGWQTRAALAAALIQNTDVLLLDEPTNFLDLPAVIWLQHYLTDELAPGTTLVVTTHDRDFADAVAERLLILRIVPSCTLETFNGTLSDYHLEMRKQFKRMSKMSAAHDKQKAHMESTIQKSVAAAKRTGDDKKLKQAASRKKKLEERSGMEVGIKGGRFKLNRDLTGYHLTNRADIEIPEFDPPVSMNISSEPPELRNTGSLVTFENVSFTYKRAKKPTLNDINLIMHPGGRVGLVGLNGSGKSTLVNMITSDFSSPSTSPGTIRGILTRHPQARIAHYTQFQIAQLLSHGQQHPEMTALSYLQESYPSIAEQPLRALLSGLSLHSHTQANTPLAALSGGQLVRVALAETLLPTPPHLLILDEVTTHLDADTIIALITALKSYKGALLIVSHDRFFVRCVVEGQSIRQASTNAEQDDGEQDDSESETDESPNGVVYRLTRTSGRMIHLARGMDEYEEVVVRQLAKSGINV